MTVTAARVERGRRPQRANPPATPSGKKTITTIRTAPISARLRIALWPPVSVWVRPETMAAPIAGPIQERVPPSAAIMIASTARPIEKTSGTVTYVTKSA